jgi:Ca2+:H+ antiporter
VPALSPYAASVVLVSATFGIMSCTHPLIHSIDKTTKVAHTAQTFIAAVLIPIARNAPRRVALLAVSLSGRVNFAIGVIVDGILQIALFVIPVLVILSWIIQQPMTLYFETFQTIVAFFTILVVNRLLQDGKYSYIQAAFGGTLLPLGVIHMELKCVSIWS